MAHPDDQARWYEGITRYQWFVLLIASLGWVFDIFEGQIFVASMNEAMPSLVEKAEVAEEEGVTEPKAVDEAFRGRIALYNNYALGAFLLGGALGGIVFGMLSDRLGRKRTMSLTIAFYSIFTCVSAFSQEWWQLTGLRFLVAMGVGGEWAVASAIVAEEFPKRARAHMGGIFHASSVFGTYLAVLAGTFLIGNAALQEWANAQGMPSLAWRIGFAIGVLPALLIVWIRWKLKEPESWHRARERATTDKTQQMGSIVDLFRGDLLGRTLVGVTLAAVGLATFWGAHIYGKDLLRRDAMLGYANGLPADVLDPMLTATRSELLKAEREEPLDEEQVDATLGDLGARLAEESPEDVLELPEGEPQDSTLSLVVTRLQARVDALMKRWEMLGMFLVTTGGGIGLVSFGPICQWLGRRGAFLLFHLGGLASAVVAFQFLHGVNVLLVALPVFGFLTLGMHAGYAIYFPELYPTRLRGTGGGFCFNAGRILAAPILFLSGWMQNGFSFDTRDVKWLGRFVRLRVELFPTSLENAATALSLLFLVGVLVLAFAPETKGQELPE